MTNFVVVYKNLFFIYKMYILDNYIIYSNK